MIQMEKPKSITQLSKEQLEELCLNLMHVDKEKAKIIEQLEIDNAFLKKCVDYYEKELSHK